MVVATRTTLRPDPQQRVLRALALLAVALPLLVPLMLLGGTAAAGTASVAAGAGPVADAHGATASGAAAGGGRLAGKGTIVARGAPKLPTVDAAAWLVADLDTGQVLAAKDPHGRYAPASTLKTLTALALLPVLPPERKLVPSHADVGVEGSKVGLVETVGYPAGELFGAMLMVSGNDAANVLASAAGGQAQTAKLMNAKAHQLGALDTRAVNAHGLDAPGQVSSAYDLALLARAGLADPTFARWVGTRSSSVSAPGTARIATRNHNRLLGSYDGALGLKNGYTSAAKASFMGAAKRDGHRIVVTLMKGNPKIFDEATKLLDWGFLAVAAPGGSALAVGQLTAPVSTRVLSGPASAAVPDQRVRGVIEGPVVPAADAARPGALLGSAAADASASRGSAPSWLSVLAGVALVLAALATVRVEPGKRASYAVGAQRFRAPGNRAAGGRSRDVGLPPLEPLRQAARPRTIVLPDVGTATGPTAATAPGRRPLVASGAGRRAG